jgi:hypothetical protein
VGVLPEAAFTASAITGEVSVEGQSPTVTTIFEPTLFPSNGEVSVEGQTATVEVLSGFIASPSTGEVSVTGNAATAAVEVSRNITAFNGEANVVGLPGTVVVSPFRVTTIVGEVSVEGFIATVEAVRPGAAAAEEEKDRGAGSGRWDGVFEQIRRDDEEFLKLITEFIARAS